MIAKFLYTIHLCILFGTIGSLAQQVNIVPSKYVLTSSDRDVMLKCESNGIYEKPSNIVMFTMKGRVIYNSADPNQLADGVRVINRTTISYDKIIGGLAEVGCSINNSVSPMPTTIPYVSQISFTHDPSKFGLNQSFSASCNYEISPSISNIVVSFKLNRTTIGQFFTVPYEQAVFNVPNRINGLSVEKGNKNFTIQVYPSNSNAQGQYRCSLTITIPTGTETVESNEWNTNGKLVAVIPSFTFLLFIAFIGFYFTSL